MKFCNLAQEGGLEKVSDLLYFLQGQLLQSHQYTDTSRGDYGGITCITMRFNRNSKSQKSNPSPTQDKTEKAALMCNMPGELTQHSSTIIIAAF